MFVVTAAALALLGFLGWLRSGRGRLGLLAFGFAAFFAAAASTAYGLWANDPLVDVLTRQTVLSSTGLLLVYLGAVKR